jgi:hypothetical protein
MIKMENKKESICFNFEKDEQKQNFFDKAKKCDIIHNNNSVFLHKILSVKNQSLLNDTLKKNELQSNTVGIQNIISEKKMFKCNSNRSLHRHNTQKSESLKQNSFANLLAEININSPRNNSNSISNIFSPKIIVNKNKNLGNIIQRDKEKDKDKENDKLYLNTYFNRDNTSKMKDKININNEFFLNPEISFSNLYTCKYLRKPVVIKFNNGVNPVNFNNTNTSFNSKNNEQKINFSLASLKEESKENKEDKEEKISCERVKTDERIKPYNFYEKKKIKSELYRSYEELERKSVEISKRKMKKKSSYKMIDFKKGNNLLNVKESLDNYIRKSKSKKKNKTVKNNNNNKNRNNKNFHIINNTDEAINSLRTNNNQLEKEKNDYIIKRANLKYNFWQDKRNLHYNYTNIKESNTDSINEEQRRKHRKDIQNISNENNLKNDEEKFFTKKKNININFIEDRKSENIYNISLNVNELYNNFTNTPNYKNSANDKNSFIRKKYGKKSNCTNNNVFEKCKNQIKNSKKDKIRGNKTPTITKKFIEDYKINDNNASLLSYSQSHSILFKNIEKKHIKVNKKTNNNTSKKLPKRINKNLPSILEEEEKIKNEIKNNLNIIKAVEHLNELIELKNKKNLKEMFMCLMNYNNENKTFNYSTLFTNVSHNSGIKYVKKIIPVSTKYCKENIQKINKHFSKSNVMKKNYFNVEKQKLIILKRKEFGFFERYEHCIDFVVNFRIKLIKYLLKEKKNQK